MPKSHLFILLIVVDNEKLNQTGASNVARSKLDYKIKVQQKAKKRAAARENTEYRNWKFEYTGKPPPSSESTSVVENSAQVISKAGNSSTLPNETSYFGAMEQVFSTITSNVKQNDNTCNEQRIYVPLIANVDEVMEIIKQVRSSKSLVNL